MTGFEDDPIDIVGKARHGLGVAGEGLPATEARMRELARDLGLAERKLADFAFRPEPPRDIAPSVPFCAIVLGTGFTSNGFILGCPESGQGVIVDPGAQGDRVIAAVRELGLAITAVLLTHGHSDHVGGLRDVLRTHQAPVYALNLERDMLEEFADVITFIEPGYHHAFGTLSAEFRPVPGHTPGMAAIRVDAAGICLTGDALFARSAGRAAPGSPYLTQLAAVRREILSLPPETILGPGHGPLTSVADELRLNPFYP